MSVVASAPKLALRCLRKPTKPLYQCKYSSTFSSRLEVRCRHQVSAPFFSRPESNKSFLQVKSQFPPARRRFSTSPHVQHGHLTPPRPGEELKITIVDQAGNPNTFTVAPGDNILDIAQSEELEMEGACGGSCACSTCHVIVQDQEYYDKMPEPEDDENDMLDLAFGLTETSRLGCQVKMTKELDGLVVKLPSMTRNLQKSDFEKK